MTKKKDYLETERLKLRPIDVSDAGFLLRLMNTPKWYEMIGDRGVRTRDDAVSYIKDRMDPDLSKKGFVNHLMILKETGETVGTCSLHDRQGINGIDVGYALLPEFEGSGYAGEGAQEMIRLGFTQFKVDQIHAITNDKNAGSSKVLEKVGFTFDRYIRIPDISERIKLYSISRSSWNGNPV